MTIRDLKKGEFFTKKPIEAPTERQVFVRGNYDRGLKKYECIRFSDISDIHYVKGNTEVYTDFTF